MNNSDNQYTNQPNKQYPLDNKVWKLQNIPAIIEEPTLTEESDLNNNQSCTRFLKSDPRCAQVTHSLIINNYSIRSVSQTSFQRLEQDQFSSYINQNWYAFELPSTIQ